MVVLVLAIAWGAVLLGWLRSRTGGSFGDSVGLFHRHLHVLERAAPSTLPPANRLRGPAASPIPLSSRLGPSRQGALGPAAYGGTPAARYPAPRPGQLRTRAPRPQAAILPSARRSQMRKRRRDVLFVLVVAVVASMAVAVAGHGLWLLQLACDAALGGYVALLVRIRNLTLEREQKLRVLYRPEAARLAPAAGYGEGGVAPAGYGQLALRRVAN